MQLALEREVWTLGNFSPVWGPLDFRGHRPSLDHWFQSILLSGEPLWALLRLDLGLRAGASCRLGQAWQPLQIQREKYRSRGSLY